MDLDFEVVELPEIDPVDVGERAPDFTRPLVTAEDWGDAALADLTADGPVVLVFYPMDGAFPATYIWTEIDERGWADRVRVVGLSISTPYEHHDFMAERGIDVPLFSDPANGVAERYGIAHDLDGMAGVSEPRPAVYVLDGDRTVRYAWVASRWPAFPDYDEVEAAIDDP